MFMLTSSENFVNGDVYTLNGMAHTYRGQNLSYYLITTDYMKFSRHVYFANFDVHMFSDT